LLPQRPVRGKEEATVDAVVADVRGVDPIEQQTIRRVAWRLMPLLMLGY
jgi:hypothetical protein